MCLLHNAFDCCTLLPQNTHSHSITQQTEIIITPTSARTTFNHGSNRFTLDKVHHHAGHRWTHLIGLLHYLPRRVDPVRLNLPSLPSTNSIVTRHPLIVSFTVFETSGFTHTDDFSLRKRDRKVTAKRTFGRAGRIVTVSKHIPRASAVTRILEPWAPFTVHGQHPATRCLILFARQTLPRAHRA